MSIRDNYTASQWATIQQAPILAGLYVAISGDRPNSVEIYEESKGVLKAMTNDPPQTARNALTNALTEDTKNGAAPPQPDLVTNSKKLTAEQTRAQALQGVLDAVAVVARVSPARFKGSATTCITSPRSRRGQGRRAVSSASVVTRLARTRRC